MNLHDHNHYKTALNFLFQERKKQKKSITYESMANFCGVQKTYLSKVLNKEGNLSLDQLILALTYLKASKLDTEFLQLLYFYNTTEITDRKTQLNKQILQIKNENLKSESHLKSETTNNSGQTFLEKYYLDPVYQLVHIFLTIDIYSHSPKLIQEKLGLSFKKLQSYLDDLIDWQLIEYKNQRYFVLKNNLHLSHDSILNTAYRQLSRQNALSKMNLIDKNDFYAFSAIISCDEETKDHIQKKYLDFLKQIQNLVMAAPSKDVYQINFDLLKWS